MQQLINNSTKTNCVLSTYNCVLITVNLLLLILRDVFPSLLEMLLLLRGKMETCRSVGFPEGDYSPTH